MMMMLMMMISFNERKFCVMFVVMQLARESLSAETHTT